MRPWLPAQAEEQDSSLPSCLKQVENCTNIQRLADRGVGGGRRDRRWKTGESRGREGERKKRSGRKIERYGIRQVESGGGKTFGKMRARVRGKQVGNRK